MKKLLLTLITAFAFCGSIFAQAYTSYWADDFDIYHNNPYEDHSDVIAFIQIEDQFVQFGDIENWVWNDAPNIQAFEGPLEVGCFVGETCRGHYFVQNHEEDYGDPMPTFATLIYYTTQDEEVSFKMYDHANHILYQSCNVLYLEEDEETLSPYTIVTGTDNYDQWDYGFWGVTLNFYDPVSVGGGIEKEILSYNGEGGWYFISSPIGEVTVSEVDNMTSNAFDLYYFNQDGDEYGKEWMNYELGNDEIGFTTLELGKGYLYANSEDVTLKFNDDAYDGEGTFPLVYAEENEDETMWGWNLMGNPYNATVTVDREFYRMVDDVLDPCEAGTEIEAMEGVMVYTDGLEEESVTFTPAEAKVKPVLSLNLINSNKVIDRAIVGFNQGNTLPKFQFNRNSSKVYFTMDNKDYAIVRSEGMGEMPVSFKANENGTYSLNLSSENVEFAYLHLIDNMTGADQDLLVNPSYSFEAKTTDYASRFRLVFATGNDEDNFAFFSNGNLVINNEGNATLQVVDVTGRIIKCENINGCASINIDAAPGVYMLRLINGDNMKVQKVVK